MPYTYEYPRPAVTADCIVITREERPRVLLIQRGGEPFRGHWALPGGFMDMDETAQQCAMRELTEETGLTVTETRQVGAYSRVDRDPRGRTVGIAYLAIIDSPMPVQGQDDAAGAGRCSKGRMVARGQPADTGLRPCRHDEGCHAPVCLHSFTRMTRHQAHR